VLAYYFVLDIALALAMLVVLGVLIWLAELIAARGAAQGWTWFGGLFVGGWILRGRSIFCSGLETATARRCRATGIELRNSP
jgi:uncharacterized membrane protein YGL010W